MKGKRLISIPTATQLNDFLITSQSFQDHSSWVKWGRFRLGAALRNFPGLGPGADPQAQAPPRPSPNPHPAPRTPAAGTRAPARKTGRALWAPSRSWVRKAGPQQASPPFCCQKSSRDHPSVACSPPRHLESPFTNSPTTNRLGRRTRARWLARLMHARAHEHALLRRLGEDSLWSVRPRCARAPVLPV